jgi:hypothetical protein
MILGAGSGSGVISAIGACERRDRCPWGGDSVDGAALRASLARGDTDE